MIKEPVLFDIQKIRTDFPILDCKVYGKNLIYFDNAATGLKPRQVVDRISEHYLYESSNVHRGIHFLSDQATQYFEDARKKVAAFINADNSNEVIFTSGTTESLNFVAQAFAENIINEGDEVLVTELEHHSNFVPWQQLCIKKNAKLIVVPIQDDGSIVPEDFESRINFKTKIVAFSYVSNALGTILPVEKIVELAKKVNAYTVVDAAQAAGHRHIDVKKIGCDFLAFSAHKMLGPTGVGVLFANSSSHRLLKPYRFGGGMVDKVEIQKTTFLEAPYCYEAGTQHIAGVLGLHSAIDYLNEIGIKNIEHYENELCTQAQNMLRETNGLTVYGPKNNRGPIISFNLEGAHPSDMASLLDQEGVAVRSGHHCTQPLMTRLKIRGTVRASLALYNTKEEIDVFYNSLKKVIKILK